MLLYVPLPYHAHGNIVPVIKSCVDLWATSRKEKKKKKEEEGEERRLGTDAVTKNSPNSNQREVKRVKTNPNPSLKTSADKAKT